MARPDRIQIGGRSMRVALPAPAALIGCHPGDLAARLAPLGVDHQDRQEVARTLTRAVELARRSAKGTPAITDQVDVALAELGARLRAVAAAVLLAGDPGLRPERTARILDTATPDEIAAVCGWGLTRFLDWIAEAAAAGDAVRALMHVFEAAADAA